MNPFIDKIFETLRAQNPNPVGELDHVNTYTLLVAVVLSAQSTDKGVNKATGPLFKVVTTPEEMVALGLDKLKGYLKTVGLYNTKSENVIKLSEKLIAEFNSQVPDSREALMSLPGVGRKTANVVLNSAFGKPTIAVDTHLFRLAHRLGFSTGKTPEAVEEDLLKVIPVEYLKDAHHWLILHGRYVCKARTPHCGECAISDFCPSKVMA